VATITFHGAAQEVTGSCHLLDSPALGRVLLDCGVRQGGDALGRIQDEGRGGSAYLDNQTRFISESRPSVYAAMGNGSESKYTWSGVNRSSFECGLRRL